MGNTEQGYGGAFDLVAIERYIEQHCHETTLADVDTATSAISMPCSKKLAAQRPEHTAEKQSGHGSSTHTSISAACNRSHKMGDIGAGHSAARIQRE